MKLRWLLLGLVLTALLVPALLLTYARLLDPQGGTWVRVVAFTPYAVALYALALLVLLLGWWRGRGAWRAIARPLAVVALAGLLLHAFWASGPYVGTPAAEAGGHPLSVMTSNLRVGQADTARVVEVAVAQDVDVLVLEEVTPEALSGLEAAGLSQALEHHTGGPATGAAGTMVFSRYPLRHVHRLGTAFGSYSADLRLPTGTLRLLAVHPRPPVGEATAWRTDQGVVRHAARASSRRTVIVGDLNATMDHVPLRTLVGLGFEDAATQADSRWQPTWPAAGQVTRLGVAVPSLVPIDHVFVSKGVRAVATKTVTIQGTDHRALLARLLV